MTFQGPSDPPVIESLLSTESKEPWAASQRTFFFPFLCMHALTSYRLLTSNTAFQRIFPLRRGRVTYFFAWCSRLQVCLRPPTRADFLLCEKEKVLFYLTNQKPVSLTPTRVLASCLDACNNRRFASKLQPVDFPKLCLGIGMNCRVQGKTIFLLRRDKARAICQIADSGVASLQCCYLPRVLRWKEPC